MVRNFLPQIFGTSFPRRCNCPFSTVSFFFFFSATEITNGLVIGSELHCKFTTPLSKLVHWGIYTAISTSLFERHYYNFVCIVTSIVAQDCLLGDQAIQSSRYFYVASSSMLHSCWPAWEWFTVWERRTALIWRIARRAAIEISSLFFLLAHM